MLSVTRRVYESPKCDNCVWRPGSVQTHWGSFSIPLDPLTAIGGGVLLLRGRKGKRRERGGKRDGIASSVFNFLLRAGILLFSV